MTQSSVAPTERCKFRHRHWVRWFVVATILLVVVVRFRLLDLPLERDEGEYAYAGQLMLQGVPPYQLAGNMKFPGTYGAYAIIMAVTGERADGPWRRPRDNRDSGNSSRRCPTASSCTAGSS